MLLQIDWRSFLLGEEEWSFLPQVLLRSAVMFSVTIIALRLIGSGRMSVFFLPDDKVV